MGDDPPPDKGNLSFAVPTSNAFACLDQEMIAGNSRSTMPPTTNIQAKPTPKPVIIFPNGKIQVIRAVLNTFTSDYLVKNTTAGVKIFPKDSTTYDLILKAIKPSDETNKKQLSKFLLNIGAKNLPFYSHNGYSAKPKKFVLYGLDPLEDNIVTTLLKDANLCPTLVKKMSISNERKRYEDESNYMIHFAHDDASINLGSLRLIKSLGGTLVSWAHFKSNSPDITVCYNCAGLGHGSRGCAMPPKCILCASNNHTINTCPLMLEKIAKNQNKIDDKLLKCPNCEGQHAATYRECPARIKVIEERQKSQFNRNASSTRKKSPAINLNQFPPLQTRRSTTPSTPLRLEVPNAWNNSIITQPKSKQVPSATKAIPTPPSNNSFSKKFNNEQCLSMLNELFDSLQACNNQFEQAKVIFELGVKYFSKFNTTLPNPQIDITDG